MDSIRLVEFVQSAAAWVAIGRLVQLKLAKRFTALLAWLTVLALSNLIAGMLSDGSPVYFWFYVFYGPVACIFAILAVRELFALVFVDYPGIRSVGRWSMYLGIVFATAASLLVEGAFRRTSNHGSVHLLYLEISQRSVVFSLVIVIVTILFALSRYPLHLGKNTYVSSAFFSALFMSDAIRLLFDSLQGQLYSRAIDQIESAFIVICLISWASMLRSESSKPVAIAESTPEEDYLLDQLASLNQLLGRTVRR
ncbi:MAG TPA: hypothetical protein VG273_05810 [Bryobacteraceae bacterium]|jgi:hypothetical protein|nr:hypothetical protein [Bryobacteraceae bacterium]